VPIKKDLSIETVDLILGVAVLKQKRAEGSEERFRLLYEEAPLGYQSLDEDGNIIAVNRAWLDALGYRREEVIGQWFGKFLTSGSKKGFKKNFPRFKTAGETKGVELEMVLKDGSRRIMSFDGRIGYDEKGNFRQTHCIMHDVTEREEAEEELKKYHGHLEELVEERTAELKAANKQLREEIEERKKVEGALHKSEERFRQFFEKEPGYCYMISPEGVILDANGAALETLGYERAELVGKTLETIYAPESLSKMNRLFPKWKKNRKTQGRGTGYRHKEGGEAHSAPQR